MRLPSLFLLLSACVHSALAAPATYVALEEDFVITTDQGATGLDDGDIVSWIGVDATVTDLVFGTDAFTSIQAAVDAVDDEGTVHIAAGTYHEGAPISIRSKKLTIEGQGDALTFLSGGGDGDPTTSNPLAHRVMDISGATVTLRNLAIVNGEVAGDGGGISAIFAAFVVVENCTISGNVAGGIGGGFFAALAELTLLDSTFEGNTAALEGGGFLSITSPVIVKRCLFYANTASRGGGMFYQDTNFECILVNNTFSGNHATIEGGGAYLESIELKIFMSHNTFAMNSAGVSAGGLWTNWGEGYYISVRCLTLLAGNTAPLHPEGYLPKLLRPMSGLEEAGVEKLSELIGPLADNGGPTRTHKLVYGNNAVDAEKHHFQFLTNGLPQTDQRGFPRLYGKTDARDLIYFDNGAYEINEIKFSSAPKNGSTNAPIDTPISLTFNGNFTFENLSEVVLRRQSDGAVIPFTPSVADNTLTLTPDGLLDVGETYHIEFNATIATNSLNEVYGPVEGSVMSFQTYTASEVYVDDAADFTPDGDHVTFKAGTVHEVTGLTLGFSAFTDIPSALERVIDGGTVHIGDGTYVTGTQILIRQDVHLKGLGVGQTILSGGNSHRIIRAAAENIEISDLTLTQGNEGLQSERGRGYGGAIHGDSSSASLTLNRVEVSDSRAKLKGGGIFYAGESLTIRDSLITSNETDGTFSHDGDGGGIYLENVASAVITNTTVSGNHSRRAGGAIAISNGSNIVLNHCTVVANSSANPGGGILNNSPLVINNTLIAGNTTEDMTGPDILGTYISEGVNFIGNTSGAIRSGASTGTQLTLTGTGTSFVEIIDTNLADNGGPTRTHNLVAASPLVDGGSNSTIPAGLTTDQRGYPRILGTTVDIGAVEFIALPTLLSSVPAADDVNVDPATSITLTFMQQIFAGPGAITLRRSDTGEIVAASISISGAVVTITPGMPLPEATRYHVEIEPDALMNVAGTSFASISDSETLGFFTWATHVYVNAAADFSPANPAAGTTVSWNSGTPDEVGGLTFGINAFTSLQVAVDQVALHGTVHIAAGTYLEGAPLDIARSLTLQGDGAANTRLSGGSNGNSVVDPGEHRVITVTGSATSVVINDLGIIDGIFSGYGGGVHLSGAATLTLNQCMLTGNHATLSGGGLVNDGGTLEVNGTTFYGNTAGAEVGGGIAALTGAGTITNSTFSGNTARNEGGGIYNGAAATMAIHLSTVTGNAATRNTAQGGGISANGPTTLNHVLVAGNSTNRVEGTDFSGSFTSVGVNFVGILNGSTPTGPGTNLTFEDTSASTLADLIGPLADNGGPTLTRALVHDSVLIDAGDNASLPGNPPFDQRGIGFNRISGGTVDIGAYEYLQQTPLLDWRILHGLDPAGADDLENLSGDGVANLLKYAFNMAPLPGDLMSPNMKVVEPEGTTGLPLIETVDGPRLSITYIRRKASSASGITYQAYSGEDLIQPTPLDSGLETVTDIDGEWERVTIVDPVSTQRRFGHLRVTK